MAEATLERRGFVPVYYLLGEELRGRIESGELSPGEQLPTERELQELHGLSRKTIRQALGKLQKEGYVAKQAGKGTFVANSFRKRKVISILLGDFMPEGHLSVQAIMSGAMWAAHQANAHTQVNLIEEIPALLEDVRAGGQPIDGFVAVRCLNDRTHLVKLIDRAGIPLVFEGVGDVPGHCSVDIDNAKAMGKVVSHLLELGHRSFGLCHFPPTLSSHFAERLVVTRRLLADALGPDGDVSTNEFSINYVPSIMEEADALLASKRHTAYICFGDGLALGLERRALEMGLRLPEAFSITGFDDEPACKMVRPAMTTIRQNYFQLGRAAAELLFQVIENYHNKMQRVKVEPELIVRESTCPPQGVQ